MAQTRAKIHTLRDWHEVKAVSDPTRIRILEALSRKAMTTKQVAQLLGEKPTNLYHHVDALVAVGLLRLTETRQVRGFLEKYYEAIADEFALDSTMLSVSDGPPREDASPERFLLSALEATLSEARLAVTADPPGRLRILRFDLELSPERLDEFISRFKQLVTEFASDCIGPRYRVAMTAFPLDMGGAS